MDAIKRIDYPQNSFFTGFQYLLHGAKLLAHPKLRLFALVPILVNILLFIGLTSLALSYYHLGITWLEEHTWKWLHSVLWLVGLVFGFLLLISYGYVFTTLTNIIGAPFYGLLAEKTEDFLSGEKPSPETLMQMLPRVIGREISKQIYFLSRSLAIFIVVLLLTFTGIGGPIGTVIVTLWGAWTLCVQYVDYPADNNQINFKPTRLLLKSNKWGSYGFGSAVMLAMMIPILNIFVAPAAVCGGTVFWLNEIKDKALKTK